MITPVLTEMGLPSGALRSDALGVNYSGSTIVGYVTLSAGGTKAYTYDGISFTQLSSAGSPGSTTGSAQACSDDGSIVIGRDEYKACIWDGGTRTSLGSFDGIRESYAVACSSDGSVVVGYSAGIVPSYPLVDRAFIWNSVDGMVEIPAPAGTASSDNVRAIGISADGSTVFGAKWLWTESGGTMASPAATVPSASTVTVVAISQNGSILAGNEYPSAGGTYPVRCVNGSAIRISMDVADPTGNVIGMSRDGSCIYWTSTDGTSYRWTVASGNEEIDFDFSLYDWSAGSFNTSGNGRVIVGTDEAGTDEGVFLLFDAIPASEPWWTAYVKTGETLI